MLNRIKGIAERLYIKIAVWYNFLAREIRFGFKGFGIKRVILISKGFNSQRSIPYDLIKWKYSDYISDFEQLKLQFINHPNNKLLNNKLIFSTFFNSYFRTPNCYCIIRKGSFMPVSSKTAINCIEDIAKLLEKSNKLILKPLEGMGAKGIYLISLNNETFQVNYKSYSNQDFRNFIISLDDYLLEEFIIQGSFTERLYPKSTNTIRLITLIDPSTSIPFVAIATLRIGTSISAPVDFFRKGGLISYINIENGKLSESMAKSNNHSLIFFDYHPETKEQIKGVLIPGWNDIVFKILQTAKAVAPLIKIVGWDLLLTDEGFAVIEGNTGPDIKIQGLNYPLAKNEHVLNFLKYYKIR